MQHNKLVQSYNSGFKNFVIGFLLGLCVMLAIAAASSNDDKNCGTYQCCAAGDDPTAAFVIDTRTGQTWLFSRNNHYDFGTPQQRKSVRSSIVPQID
jgi:hypothetical protein